MAALIQFVDSIDADPTVRLDINDGVSWFCQLFKAPLPRLRRSEGENSMRDGGVVGSSTYGNRTLEIDLTLVEESSEEWAADEMQKLWRELDRPANFIRYWPEGLDSPVFFRTFRSDVDDLEELWTTPIARNISLEILAEPFALGLRENLGPFSIANDPSAPGCTVDVTDVKGDVTTPILLTQNIEPDYSRMWLACGIEQEFVYAMGNEGGGLGSDLTLGADTAFGASEIETTLAGASAMAERVSWTLPTSMARGAYRVLAWVESTADASLQAWTPGPDGTQAAVAAAKDVVTAGGFTQIVDLGVFSAGDPNDVHLGYLTASPTLTADLSFRASSPAAATVTWIAFALVPAGESSAIVRYDGAEGVTLDGILEKAVTYSSVNGPAVVGGFPKIAPGETNHLTVVCGKVGAGHIAARMSEVVDVTLDYWPRYLFVRPVSS